ncbi:MAG: hypothetical protein AB7T49_19490 [Oligoflexales bacterium]
MKYFSRKAVVLCILWSTSCKMRDSMSSAMTAQDTPPTLQCESGETPVFFGMKAQENLPGIETLGIPHSLWPNTPNQYDIVDPNKTERLGICVNEGKGTARLAQVVSRREKYLVWENWSNPKIKGLERLVFENSQDGLNIEVETGPGDVESVRGLVIRGMKTTSYFYTGQKATVEWVPMHYLISAGTWEMGDPFLNAVCTAGETFERSSFRLGSAKFATEYCTEYLSEGTTRYRFIKLTITDTEEQLASEEREVVLTGADEINKVLALKITHHNFCDSMHLRLPDREFWATGAATMAMEWRHCLKSDVLPGAPHPPNDGYFEQINYKVRYGDGNIIDGRLENCELFVGKICY